MTVDPTRFELLASEHRSVARRVLDALKPLFPAALLDLETRTG